MKHFFFPLLLFSGIACTHPAKPATEKYSGNDNNTQVTADTPALEKKLISAGLVNIQKLQPQIDVDLKYSTTDNFLHEDVYGELTNAYLQPDVAQMLLKAWDQLQLKDSNYTFLVYDAVRPLSIQQKMWAILQMPLEEKEKYLSNPVNGSIHNYGAAVDMSLIKKNGTPVDMGTPFDYFGELAEPQLEMRLLQEGKLTQVQLDNRRLLRDVMQSAGFRQLPTEWWHYNACSREEANIRYVIVN